MGRYWELALVFVLVIAQVTVCYAQTEFIVVVGNKVLKKYAILADAKKALRDGYPSGSRTPLRIIVQAKDGVINTDPTFVRGEEQAAGLSAGFNVWWDSWQDVLKMITIAQNSMGTVNGRFLVVYANKVVGDFKTLQAAKDKLMEYPKANREPSRMVVEVQGGRVLDDPRFIAGRRQMDGLSAGFNKFWTGWGDIDNMLWAAEDYLTKPKPGEDVTGTFVVVTETKVIGKFEKLSVAKAELMKLPKGKSPTRMIVEVKNNQVLDDPRYIANQNQEAGISNGFNRYWTGWNNIDQMLWLVEDFLKRPDGDADGRFLVVAGNRVVGDYNKLSDAQSKLKEYPKGAKSPIRMVVEVENDKRILDDPRIIAGRRQMDGVPAGFNRYWRPLPQGWIDIDDMLYAAEAYLQSSGNPQGTFLVVAGDKVVGKFDNLNDAKNALNKYPPNAEKPSRMVIEVKDNKVLDDPRFIAGQNQGLGLAAGFNNKWKGWPDIDRMLDIGQNYLSPSPSPKPIKGEFIVIVRDQALGGIFKTLQAAKDKLMEYPTADKPPRRMIFEIKNGKVSDDPRFIAGQYQFDRLKEGFNSHWKDWANIYEMLDIAEQVYEDSKISPSATPSKSAAPDALGEFLVVVNNNFFGVYEKLSDAKKKLLEYPTNQKNPIRFIIEVKDGDVVRNPNTIAGQKQRDGLDAGFNSWWPNDLSKVMSKYGPAQQFYNKQVISPSPTPSISPADRKFLVYVKGEPIMGPFETLDEAKKTLDDYSPVDPSSPPPRFVMEVINGKVKRGIDEIAGENQAAGLPEFNRNVKGVNAKQLKAIFDKAQKKVDQSPSPTPSPSSKSTPSEKQFVVFVQGKKPPFSGPFPTLEDAKKELNKIAKKNAPPPRFILEVNDGKVKPNVRIVGGENQAAGLPEFNRYWKGWKARNFRPVYNAAQKYVDANPSPSTTPTPDVTGEFIVIVGDKEFGIYTKLSEAKQKLLEYTTEQKEPIRFVLEVQKGQVVRNPNIVGGQRQIDGMEAGFNRFWPSAEPSATACPRHFKAYRGKTDIVTCSCTAQTISAGGTVWGTLFYTDDSAICKAARHAGVIDSSGGTVSVKPSAGRLSYTGSTRNGITTNNYGSWAGTFSFEKLDPTPAPAPSSLSPKYDDAQRFYNIKTTPSPSSSPPVSSATQFVVFVQGKKPPFSGPFPTLEDAKKELKKNGKNNAPPPRFILEVNDGKVKPNVRTVGGENQAAGLPEFNSYWKGWKARNFRPVYNAAQKYVDANPSPSTAPTPDVMGEFIVIVGDKEFGIYTKLSEAKQKLLEYTTEQKEPIRFVLEVQNGQVVRNPNIVGGQRQIDGMEAGFNRFWPSTPPSIAACPRDFKAYRGKKDTVTCSCTAQAISAGGTVWGTLFYTDDSAVCKAARHAGIIDRGGGTVSVKPSAGRPSYTGSTRKGITTSNYGSWAGTFSFEKPDPTPAPAPSSLSSKYDDAQRFYNTKSSASPSSSPSTSSGKQFVVFVQGKKPPFSGPFPTLEDAKKELNKHAKKNAPPPRFILEVNDGKVKPNVRIVGGENQAAGLPEFNRYWKGWKARNFRPVYNAAQKYVDANPSPSTTPTPDVSVPSPSSSPASADVIGEFVVVVNGKKFGIFTKLSEAKDKLSESPIRQSAPVRFVAEIKNGKVVRNPRIVGGQRQDLGMRFGFNRWWPNLNAVRRQYNSIQKFYDLKNGTPTPGASPSNTPQPETRGFFIVVALDNEGKPVEIMKTRKLGEAKTALNRYPRGAKSPSRAVFEVTDGKCQPNPRTVAGEQQYRFTAAGFNSFWFDWWDLNVLLEGCVKSLFSGDNPATPPPIPTSGNTCNIKDPCSNSILVVVKGGTFKDKCGRNYKVESDCKLTAILATSTPVPQCPAGNFIVVAGEKVIRIFDDLCKAKKRLEGFPQGAKSPSRTIFEIKNGKVQPDPRSIAGHTTGMNRWYWDWWDINRMLAIAVSHLGNS